MFYLNGKFITEDKAKISVLEPGFLFGLGLFETMRAYNSKIVYLKQHFVRLRRSCRLISIRLTHLDSQLEEIIKRLVEMHGFRDAHVRLVVWAGAGKNNILVMVRKYKPPILKGRYRGFSACVSPFRQAENSFFARIKTTNRLFYELGRQAAKDGGFNEAIILNTHGYLAEGSRSNIFFVKDNEIFTPALSCGCLDGITRKVIFDLARDSKFRVDEGNFTLRDLHEADEAFFTNSLIGVMPLTSLERRKLGSGTAGRLTKFFMREYNAMLENGN